MAQIEFAAPVVFIPPQKKGYLLPLNFLFLMFPSIPVLLSSEANTSGSNFVKKNSYFCLLMTLDNVREFCDTIFDLYHIK